MPMYTPASDIPRDLVEAAEDVDGREASPSSYVVLHIEASTLRSDPAHYT